MIFRLFKISAILPLLLSQLFSQVIITEVMYNPAGSDSPNEFVELYNSSSTNTVDLKDWTISDISSIDTFTDAGQGLSIPLLGYAVIMENDYDITNGIYKDIIPADAIVIKVGTTTIGNNLNLSDSLYLKNNSGTLVDSYGWTNIAAAGYSLEKVRVELPNTTNNWKESKTKFGTPGYLNSVTPLNVDGAIQGDISFTPAFAKTGETVVAKVSIYNTGIQNINGMITATYNGIIVGSANSPSLIRGQIAFINISLSSFPSGRHNIIFDFSVANDENLSNNTASKKLNISYTPGLVKINEFHSNPADNQIEFVELVSFGSIVMDGWRISDNSSSKLIPITYIKTGEYAVLASDTSIKSISNPDAHYLIPYGGLPTLNNSGDGIYLLDMNHTVIDSVIYGTGWPVVADTSTEKLRPDFISNDPVNWKTSTDNAGMTPGYVNSIYLIDYDGEIISDSIYHKPEFPKSNESVELFLPITNHGAQPISGSIKVYKNNIEIGSAGFNDIARRDTSIFQISLPTMVSGIHPLQIKLEIDGDQNLSNNTAVDTIFVSYEFGSVLINEFLPRPTSPQAEFVELLSFDNVDLTNWSIADKTNTLHHFNGGKVSLDKFIVLSEDPAFATIIPSEATFVEVEDFPSLNNYGDAIYLRDFTGTIIDSLIYTTWWELATAKSTEKIHPEFMSKDSTGWKVSTDSTGMTPGKSNSVVVKNIDGAILPEKIIVSPEFPESTELIIITIPIINNGLQPISGNLIIGENNIVLASSTFNGLAMSDTTYIEIEISSLSSGRHEIAMSLNIIGDEDLENNTASIPVLVSYNFGAVTLNEFLADPEAPLSEFVEIITQEVIDFNGWAISDNRKILEDFFAGLVESGTYIILSEDTNLVALIPSDALYINIDNFPSLNNSGDGIFIYDFTGKIIDSLNYNSEWPLKSGKSAEKLHPEFISNDGTRWNVCTDTANTTIGRANSILMQNINGAILPELTNHYPEFPHPSESISFDIAVINNGITDISGSVSVIYNDQELGTESFTMLKSEDTTFVSFNIEPLPSGHNLLEILLEIPGDMNTFNNLIEHSVFVNYPFGAVVFNEFMVQPDSTQAEFIEIVSFSNIDFTGWAISDETGTKHYFGELLASANQLIVVVSDSVFVNNLSPGTAIIIPTGGLPTLNNSSDAIFLYDMTGAIIDSLHYDSEWPVTNGRSTEKFRPEFESYNMNRWGIAVNAEAMTPGLENSLHFDELPQTGAITFEANPFSPNGDGVNDELLIKYKLPFAQGIIKLQIFDMTGRNIATPYWNVHFPQEGLLKWDGKRSDGNNARIGIYIIKVTAKDPATGKTWEKVKTVVLAKQL